MGLTLYRRQGSEGELDEKYTVQIVENIKALV